MKQAASLRLLPDGVADLDRFRVLRTHRTPFLDELVALKAGSIADRNPWA